MINELDVVALNNDKPEYRLQAGTIGTVVSVFQDGKAFLVEFSELEDDANPLVDLTIDDVHKASAAEITKYNEIARTRRNKVVLTRDIPEKKLKKGDLGTVIFAYDGGRESMVEFASLAGETIAILALEAEDIREIRATELAHVRECA